MANTRDPRSPRPRHLHHLPAGARSLPVAVPLLQPDQPITPAQDALLTAIARQARLGDHIARDLLWRAFAPKLEPAVRRAQRVAWATGWARRNGRPWELDDARQEAWLTFADLVETWPGEGSFIPFVMSYFPWRLRNAMRQLGPPRLRGAIPSRREPVGEDAALTDGETEALLAALMAALSPTDARVLQLRLREGLTLGEIADRLDLSRRTVYRGWARVQHVARCVLTDSVGPREE
jgi:RNA polymerase sigma factor (sigma-70 family)